MTVNEPRTVVGPGGATARAWKNALGEYEPDSDTAPPGPTAGADGAGAGRGAGGEADAGGVAGLGAAGDGFGALFVEPGAFAGGPATPGDVGVARADAAEPSPGISPEVRPVEAVVNASARMTAVTRFPGANRSTSTAYRLPFEKVALVADRSNV